MKLLVIGAPYSGIPQMVLMLRSAGYDVGEECIRRDGMVKTFRDGCEINTRGFEHVLHLVRNPLYSIPYYMRDPKLADGRMRDRINSAAFAWSDFNTRIQLIAGRFIRIEMMGSDWPVWLFSPKKHFRVRNIKPDISMSRMPQNIIEQGRRYSYTFP